MNSRISSYFFFVLLLVAVVAAVLILVPFLSPLLLALAAAVIMNPLYRRIANSFGATGTGRTIAALISVIIVIIIIVIPVSFLVTTLYSEIQTLYAMLTDEANRSQVITSLNNVSQWFSDSVFGVVPAHSFDSLNVTEFLKGILQTIFTNLDSIFSSIAKICGYALVFILATFYFLKDGATLKRRLITWSPLLDSNDEYITFTLKRAIRSVFSGNLVVCLAHGVSIGLAFWVLGIPAPALWGTAAAVAALVPGFGVSLLVLPGVAYLVLTGHYAYAVGLFVWGYTEIFVVDHIIGPAFMNRGIQIHPFLILLSVLGGIFTFGIIGFVLGPLILVFLFSLLEIYRRSFGSSAQIITDTNNSHDAHDIHGTN